MSNKPTDKKPELSETRRTFIKQSAAVWGSTMLAGFGAQLGKELVQLRPRPTREQLRRDLLRSDDGAPLDAWLPGLQMTSQAARDAGVNSHWNEFVLAHLEQAVVEGHGQGELAAIFEQLRKPTI